MWRWKKKGTMSNTLTTRKLRWWHEPANYPAQPVDPGLDRSRQKQGHGLKSWDPVIICECRGFFPTNTLRNNALMLVVVVRSVGWMWTWMRVRIPPPTLKRKLLLPGLELANFYRLKDGSTAGPQNLDLKNSANADCNCQQFDLQLKLVSNSCMLCDCWWGYSKRQYKYLIRNDVPQAQSMPDQYDI